MVEALILRLRFGRRVKDLLQQKGLDAGHLADLSELPIARIDRILKGNYARMTMKDMEIIARVLETALYSLLAPPDAQIGPA